ncbi:MFS transporter [Actinomadura kijaniata]|uniref:MFS transporter n=1 Tax=Actinomadura kijaniata TaxID=46161 RepID=UPI001471A584|nr:MFS transporter [Actinomadura kijaniata]
MLALFLVTLGMWIGLLAATQILLPAHIESLDPAHKVRSLSLVVTVAAVAAIISAPLVGAISDRTKSRFGRRRPWVVGCALVCSAALFSLPAQSSLLGVGVCWVLVHAGVNGMHAALCATVADRVPVHRRGTVSAVAGLAMPLGLVVGSLLVAGLSTGNGYLLVGALVVLLTVPYAVLAGDGPRTPGPDAAGPSSGRPPGRSPRDLYLGPWRHPAFAWAWASRFFAQLATSLATLYLLYFLRDEVRVGDPAGGVAVLSLLYTAGAVAASVAAGWLSDRTGRRKPFVVAGTLLMAGALIAMAAFPHWSAAMGAGAVLGTGYGVYLAVDQALVTQVLPHAQDHARDLGLVNIAGSGAVAVAPLAAAQTMPLGGFPALFGLATVCALAAGASILPIRSVR